MEAFDKNKLTNDELEGFPDLHTYINNLNTLKNLDLSSCSQEEISKIFFEYARINTHPTGIHSPRRFNQLTFYRVRLNIDVQTEDLSLIRTYSYPLPQYCKENGRANLAGRSVFYCSNEPIGAILESKPKAGDIGYLSVWQANTFESMKLGIFLPNTLAEENVWVPMAKGMFESANKGFRYAQKKSGHLQALHQFIAERFVEDKKPYSLTSWLANTSLYGELTNDFIIYPSVLMNNQFCNMAFHPNSADRYLKFKKVIRFRVESIKEENKLELSFGKVGELAPIKILWRNVLKDELTFISGNIAELTNTEPI